jgi:hypothetical protein
VTRSTTSELDDTNIVELREVSMDLFVVPVHQSGSFADTVGVVLSDRF